MGSERLRMKMVMHIKALKEVYIIFNILCKETDER